MHGSGAALYTFKQNGPDALAFKPELAGYTRDNQPSVYYNSSPALGDVGSRRTSSVINPSPSYQSISSDQPPTYFADYKTGMQVTPLWHEDLNGSIYLSGETLIRNAGYLDLMRQNEHIGNLTEAEKLLVDPLADNNLLDIQGFVTFTDTIYENRPKISLEITPLQSPLEVLFPTIVPDKTTLDKEGQLEFTEGTLLPEALIAAFGDVNLGGNVSDLYFSGPQSAGVALDPAFIP